MSNILNIKLPNGIYYFIFISILLVSFISVQANFKLILFTTFIVLYILLTMIFNPLRVFIFFSIIFVTIKPNYQFHGVPYIGGVGASDFYLGIPHIVIFLFLISWLIDNIRFRQMKRFRLEYGRASLFLFILMSFCATLVAPYKQASLSQLNFYIAMFLLHLIWVNVLLSFREFPTKLIIISFVLATIPQFLISLFQIIRGDQIGLGFLGEGAVSLRQGIDFPSVTGTMVHSNPLSLFYAIVISMLFPFVLKQKQNLAVIGFIVALLGLLLTFTRTSILVTFAVAIFQIILLKKQKEKYFSNKKLILFVLIVLTSIFFLGDYLLDRFKSLFTNSTDDQLNNRLIHDLYAWSLIREKLFIGYGLNNWHFWGKSSGFNSYILGRQYFYYLNPVHNIYLLIWFEGGFLYLLSFLMIFVSTFSFLIKLILKQNNYLALSVFSSLVVILMTGLVDWSLFAGGQLYYCMYFILAIGYALNKKASILNHKL